MLYPDKSCALSGYFLQITSYMRKLFFGVMALLFVACSPSAKETAALLDKGFAEIMERHNAVGLMVAAVKDGEVVYNASYGYKDMENKVPVGEDDKLRIASISKTFVATAVMQLVEQGNTVIVIEHNLDVIKLADHIIDVGPDGGDKGGCIIGEGTPESIVKKGKGFTAKFLKEELK